MRRAAARVVVALGVVLGTVAVGGAGPVPVAPAGATVGDPPTSVALGGEAVRAVVVHRATGRVFVAGTSAVQVFAADLTPLGTIPVAGTDLADAGTSMALLSSDPVAVVRIDPTTLTTTTWSLGERYRPSGLVAGEGRALTTAVLPAGVGALGEHALVEVDLATGATKDLVTGMGSRPWRLTGAPWKTIAVEHVAATSGAPASSRVWQISSPQAGAATVTRTGSIPVIAVRDAELSHDVIGLTVTTDTVPGEARAYRLSDLAPFPTIEVGDGPVALGAGYLLGVTTVGQASIEVLDPFHVDDRLVLPVPATTLPGSGRRLAFGPGDTRLYATGGGGTGAAPARLVAFDLAPAATAVSPQVVDVDGGATLTVTGRGLAGGRADAFGIPLTVSSSTDTTLTLTAGTVWGGPAPVDLDVASGLHVPAPGDLRLRALQLGPYTDGRDLADGAAGDVWGRAATPTERATIDSQLLADGDPGRIFATWTDAHAFRGARADVLRLYHATLGRAPDREGLLYWDEVARSGRPYSRIVRAFTGSPEFRARYGTPTDAGFVDLLYRNVLDRAPDAAGRAYWIGELRRGVPRHRVVLLVTDSPENIRRYQPEAAVTLLALAMLDRMPTAAERTRWVAAIRGGATASSVATEILRTSEYAAAHP